MTKKILVILASLLVFPASNYCYAQYAVDDLNLDGKKDFTIDFSTDNPVFSERGENYKYAEFDTNFDGNMDIIINFSSFFGSFKRDSNFDGKFDIKYRLVHIRPVSIAFTSWLGRLDTWYVVGLFPGVKNLLDCLIDSYTVAERNYIITIKKSIRRGLDINAKDISGSTLLMRVVKSGYVEIAKLLIANGANINVKNNDGITILMQAIERGFPGLAKSTILMTEDTVQRDDLKMAQLLIENGADVNAKGKDGSTVLIQAIKKGYFEIAKLLIANGADINAKGKDGSTLLIQAINKPYSEKSYLNIVKLLLENGIDVNAQDNNGFTALMFALQKDYYSGYLDLARLLIANGADVNIKANDGSAVLLQVAKRSKLGYFDIAKLLIEKAADVNAKDNSGLTALIAAVQSGGSGIPALLVEKGVDINTKDSNGLTALIERGQKYDFQMVWLLMHLGADVNARDINGDTVLMQFIRGGYPEQAEELVMEGLALNVKNNGGMTPLMYAVKKGFLKLANTMLLKGADVKAKDKNGQTAFDIAEKMGNNKMVSLIKQYTERQMWLYKNEKYRFKIKVFTDRMPLILDWGKKRHPNMPWRLGEAAFLDRSFGVVDPYKQDSGIPAIKITVNECLPQQDVDACLQMAASDCEGLPYGELIVAYNNESLKISPADFLGLPSRNLRVSCIKNTLYEGIAILRENLLYTFMFLTVFESGKAFPRELFESMLSTVNFIEWSSLGHAEAPSPLEEIPVHPRVVPRLRSGWILGNGERSGSTSSPHSESH